MVLEGRLVKVFLVAVMAMAQFNKQFMLSVMLFSIFHIVIRDEISTLFKAFNEKDWIFQCYSAFRYFNELMRH